MVSQLTDDEKVLCQLRQVKLVKPLDLVGGVDFPTLPSIQRATPTCVRAPEIVVLSWANNMRSFLQRLASSYKRNK